MTTHLDNSKSNLLVITHPEIAAQWHPTKNSKFQLEQMTSRSGKKVWWLGECGHEWDSVIQVRVRYNSGCPICKGRRLLSGFNDLLTKRPDLVAQWHPTLNGDLSVQDIIYSSGKSAWWLGDCGHEWEALIRNRTILGNGCPICKGKKVLVGFNDLATVSPDIAKEWSSRNKATPQEVTISSGKEYWWICTHGHEWKVSPAKRNRGDGCPYCSGHRLKSGFNDLQAKFPEVAKEWSHKNARLASQISAHNGDSGLWECDRGHEWIATVDDRTRGTGCPHYSNSVSAAEREIVDWLKKVVPNESIRTSVRSIIPPRELDIYLPHQKVAIEFNGLWWHSERFGKDSSYHYEKHRACAEQGIRLIHVWEDQWRDKKELVKRMLAVKLGVSQLPRIYARNTTIVSLRYKEVKPFLEKNHIQGAATGFLYLGLKHDEDLVAAMVLHRQGTNLVLSRYATSCAVVGGHSKLLKWVDANIGYEAIITFADLEVSDGNLYEKTGFVKDRLLKPDYRYLYKDQRQHKFGFRKERFRKDPLLLFDESLSEKELADLNEIPRIWDSGKIRYTRANPTSASKQGREDQ